MASFEQIIKFENEKPNGVVRLVEAHGFYRAYNQSAYLFHQAIARHKVTKKFVKNINQQLVYIGFPADRLLERIGTRSHKKTEFGYDVELAADELPSDEGYDEWRKTIPTEAASRDVKALSIDAFTRLFDLSENLAKQLASWQRFSQKQQSSDASASSGQGGRPESVGSRFGGACHTANPMKDNGDPTANTEVTS